MAVCRQSHQSGVEKDKEVYNKKEKKDDDVNEFADGMLLIDGLIQ